MEVVRYDWRNILRGIGLRIAETAGYAVSITYMIRYLNSDRADRPGPRPSPRCASRPPSASAPPWPGPRSPTGSAAARSTSCVCAFGIVWGVLMFALVNTGPFVVIMLTLVISYTRLPERPRRRPGRLVPRAVHRRPPRLRRLAGLPDLGHGLRLHPVHHHAAVRQVRLGRARRCCSAVRADRPDRRPRSPGRRSGRAERQIAAEAAAGRSRCPSTIPPTSHARRVSRLTSTTRLDRPTQTGRAQFAYRMRHHVLDMGEEQGQGYVGQALGAADMFAAVYADRLRYRADDPHWDGRDRFLLSTGHYAIGLYAALAEAGIVRVDELATLRLRRLPAADVGNGQLHPGHGDLRRIARPRTAGRGRAGARPAAPRLGRAGLQLPLRRRAQRGLDLGGRDGCGRTTGSAT